MTTRGKTAPPTLGILVKVMSNGHVDRHFLSVCEVCDPQGSKKHLHEAEFPQTAKKSGLQLDRRRHGSVLPPHHSASPSFMFGAIILILRRSPFSSVALISSARNAEMRRRWRRGRNNARLQKRFLTVRRRQHCAVT